MSDMKREYDNCKKSEHPNVAKVYGYGQDSVGDICMVMEYHSGGTFKDFIEGIKKK